MAWWAEEEAWLVSERSASQVQQVSAELPASAGCVIQSTQRQRIGHVVTRFWQGSQDEARLAVERRVVHDGDHGLHHADDEQVVRVGEEPALASHEVRKYRRSRVKQVLAC